MRVMEPVAFKNLTLKNRVIWTPAVTCLADDAGYVTDLLIERHVARAKGNVSLIQVEACGVLSRKSPKLLRICDDSYIDGHKRLCDAVHEAGAKISLQLIHYVKQARSGWKQSVEEITLDEIEEIKDQFVEAGIRTKKAGYDAIDLHTAHGYTLASFISALNKRTDEYGKNTAGRCKIATDIITRLRAEVGPDYCIGARINGEEFIKGGNTLKQSPEVARLLCEAGLNFLSVSAGGKTEDGPWYTGYSGERTMPTPNHPWGCNVYLAEAIRKEIAPMGIPIITAGRIPTLEFGEEILAKGQADLIGICRPLLADPEWITKQVEGRQKDIVQCIYCNECMARDRAFEPVNCIVAEKKAAKKATKHA